MKSALVIAVGCMFTLISNAQENTSLKKWKFHSTEQLIFLNGSNGISGAITSINGLSYHTIFAGAGAGMDFYFYRTIPVFFSLQKEIGQKKRHPFVYGNTGYNIPWTKKEENNTGTWWSIRHSEFSGGLYTDLGAGYVLTMKNNDALLLSIGYSYKYVEEERTFKSVESPPATNPDPEIYKYRFNRLAINVGWRF